MDHSHVALIRSLLDKELATNEQMLASAQNGVWRAKPVSTQKTRAERELAAKTLARATEWLDECKQKHRLTQDTIAAFEALVKT